MLTNILPTSIIYKCKLFATILTGGVGMYKKIIGLFIVLTSVLALSACSSKETGSTSDPSKLQVVVTFNAMRELTEAVGKDKVQIVTMIPDGMEPHDFEPKARDLEELSNAKVFIYNGLGMENWVDKTLETVDNGKLISVDASKGVKAINAKDEGETGEEGTFDPHAWLSLKDAEIEAKNIKDALQKEDPSNKEFYEKNYETFLNSLESLYGEYNQKFNAVTNKNFVTGHAAFAYLCRDFGLKQNSVEDVFAEGEPSARRMKDLIDYCKQNKIKTIFVEDMVSPKVSETLAKEADAGVSKINTLESKEDNKDYIQSMKDNLEEIYQSLK